jgi:hypothetical protein
MRYALCISDMNLSALCVYLCAYLYVCLTDTARIYQFILVLYVYVFLGDMHMQDS